MAHCSRYTTRSLDRSPVNKGTKVERTVHIKIRHFCLAEVNFRALRKGGPTPSVGNKDAVIVTDSIETTMHDNKTKDNTYLHQSLASGRQFSYVSYIKDAALFTCKLPISFSGYNKANAFPQSHFIFVVPTAIIEEPAYAQ